MTDCSEERRVVPDSRIQHLEIDIVRLQEKLVASDQALLIANKAIEGRLHDMNELRAQINQERGHYVSRPEYENKTKEINNELSSVQKFQWMLTGAFIIIQILTVFFMHFIKAG